MGGPPLPPMAAAGMFESARPWLLWLNVLGALAHLSGIIVTVTVARMNFGLVLYDIEPVYDGNITRNDTDGNEYVQHLFQSRLVEALTIRPGWVIVAFFGFSLLAHSIIVFALFFTDANWYIGGLKNCRAPWRCELL